MRLKNRARDSFTTASEDYFGAMAQRNISCATGLIDPKGGLRAYNHGLLTRDNISFKTRKKKKQFKAI